MRRITPVQTTIQPLDKEAGLVRQRLPHKALNAEGRRRSQEPGGFLIYLALVSAYGSRPNDAGSGRSFFVFSDITDPMWDAYRDQYIFDCLTGEWFSTRKTSDPKAFREEWFQQTVPVLKLASNAWEARHAVSEAVREELNAIGSAASGSEDADRFLENSFIYMGQVMAGAAAPPYMSKLVRSRAMYSKNIPQKLHELFRKQSVFLWNTLLERAAGTYEVPLYWLLGEITQLEREI